MTHAQMKENLIASLILIAMTYSWIRWLSSGTLIGFSSLRGNTMILLDLQIVKHFNEEFQEINNETYRVFPNIFVGSFLWVS